MRGVALTTASFVLTAAVVGHAYYQKKQFYPSVVYITKSNPSMAVSIKAKSTWKSHNLAYTHLIRVTCSIDL